MRVIVIGAGVIGVTTAWYLAMAGHEVLVLERQPGPALETSFANAGEISACDASPWASPGLLKKLPRWLLVKHAPVILRLRLDPAMLRWLGAALRNCSERRYRLNKARMGRLAEYSRLELTKLREETGIEFDHRALGTLQLFRTEAALEEVSGNLEMLRAEGIPVEVLDSRACITAEPGLARSHCRIAGGLRLPRDETGDCAKFTAALAARAEGQGVRFQYGVSVRKLELRAGRIAGVICEHDLLEGDAVVVAAGSHSPALVRIPGLSLPVYPVKGYSITVPVADESCAPVSTLLDERYKVAITRLGARIRVGGMAEICGFNLDLDPHRRLTLERCLSSLFPGGGDLAQTTFWCGLRPMTPDGAPVIGAAGCPNLFLNTGHGTLGWTMACGSARILADLLTGRAPELDAGDYSLERYAG